jgi:hypothetical protein
MHAGFSLSKTLPGRVRTHKIEERRIPSYSFFVQWLINGFKFEAAPSDGTFRHEFAADPVPSSGHLWLSQ